MLHAVQGDPFGYILAGIIWAVTLGFAAGNYACSLVHRLPRGRLILDKTPYCGTCGAMLKPIDLFPVFSALALRHRCRYCKSPFPVSHTWTEILVGLVFALTYLEYGFSEQFLLVVAIGIFLITLAAIEANEKMIMSKVLVIALIFGVVFRTLQDATLYGFIQGGGAGFILGMILQHKKVQKVGHIYSIPPLAQLLTVGGICVGIKGFLPFIVLFALLGLAAKLSKNIPVTVPFGIAVMIPVLYPSLF